MHKTLLFLFFLFFCNYSNAQCDNVYDGGTISFDESNCGPFDPAEIIEISAPQGGSGVLEYMWLATTDLNNFGAQNVIAGANSISYNPGFITETTWFVRCVRRSGCSEWLGEDMVQKTVNPFYVNVDITNMSCGLDSLGSIDITPINGHPPYNILINGILANSFEDNLVAGSYFIQLTDSMGCSFETTAEIEEAGLSISVLVNDNPCSYEDDYANVSIDQGQWPYNIQWSNAASSWYIDSDDGPLQGSYWVTVEDANGCVQSDTITFGSGLAPSVSIPCCLDTIICANGMVDLPIFFSGDGPWILTWMENNQIMIDTFYNAMQNLQLQPTTTTFYDFISIEGTCNSQNICQSFQIAVEDCSPNACGIGCFSADVSQLNEVQGCYEYQMNIHSNGCQHDLSNMTISVGCGTISNLYNDYGYSMSIINSPDPNTGLTGIKIDNMMGIDDYNPMRVSFKVCPDGCNNLRSCDPIVAFKAANCVSYENAYRYSTLFQYHYVEVEIDVYPNPFQELLNLNLKHKNLGKRDGHGELMITDLNGRIVRQWRINKIQRFEETIQWDGLTEDGKPADRGIYFIHYNIPKANKRFSSKVFKH